MKNRTSGIAAVRATAAVFGGAGAAQALDIVMINANAAAQSDQRTMADLRAGTAAQDAAGFAICWPGWPRSSSA
jgi:hypothetical protein